MGRREDLIAKYADDLRMKCGVEPDMALLEKVTIGCGPAVYHPDGELVAASDPQEVRLLKDNFLIRKLALDDGAYLDAAIDQAIETYGRSEPRKYRAVIHYLLTRHFDKEYIYGFPG